jgi:hypothetical protein
VPHNFKRGQYVAFYTKDTSGRKGAVRAIARVGEVTRDPNNVPRVVFRGVVRVPESCMSFSALKRATEMEKLHSGHLVAAAEAENIAALESLKSTWSTWAKLSPILPSA